MYPETILLAWAAPGMHPWNLEKMLESPHVTTKLPPEIVQRSQKRKRSGITLSEKLITSDEVINSLKVKDTKAEAPKKPRGRPKKKRAVEPSSEGENSQSINISDSE